MKIKKIGNVTLTNPLWWVNYNTSDIIQASTEDTISGGVIVWQQERTITGRNIDLSSLADGWQKIGVVSQLKTLINSGVGTTITLSDDTIINVRFRYETTAYDFKRLVEASLFDYYSCKINLARI